jgi:hypothetical protein
MKNLNARPNIVQFDFAANKVLVDWRRGRVPKKHLNAIARVGLANRLVAELHFFGADLGLWLCGRNDVHAFSPRIPP